MANYPSNRHYHAYANAHDHQELRTSDKSYAHNTNVSSVNKSLDDGTATIYAVAAAYHQRNYRGSSRSIVVVGATISRLQNGLPGLFGGGFFKRRWCRERGKFF